MEAPENQSFVYINAINLKAKHRTHYNRNSVYKDNVLPRLINRIVQIYIYLQVTE